MATTATRSALVNRPAASPRPEPAPALLTLFAWSGAFFLSVAAWCWIRWILSDNFRPVDPGPDPLPAWQFWALGFVQIGGLAGAFWLAWRYALAPRLATGRFTTEGLVCLALPTVWFQDLMFGYGQTWMVYNAHLWNMGSWAKQVPGWLARHPENMLEPLVVLYGYIFWMLPCMLAICGVMRSLRERWPSLSEAKLLGCGFAFTFLLDMAVEGTAIYIGWYSLPGAWRPLGLFGGTPYQLPFHGVFLGAVQTMAFALVLYYRERDGLSFVERGVERLRFDGARRTLVRYLALAGAFQLFFFVTYSMPMGLWSATHSERWVDGMPSYFTAMCPEYATDRAACGGPGIPIPRPPHVWLPDD